MSGEWVTRQADMGLQPMFRMSAEIQLIREILNVSCELELKPATATA